MDFEDSAHETGKIDESIKLKKQKKSQDILIQRSEASLNISEFNLNEAGNKKVDINELIQSSQKLTGQEQVKKQLKGAKEFQSLAVPLSKPELHKIKRSIAYEKVCGEVTQWDSVVHKNRVADQMIYPLKRPDVHLKSFNKVSESFITKHPVEIAVSQLLNKSENNLGDSQELTVAEEKALHAMSPEEAKLRHEELMKHRALVSYKISKSRWRNKIKSKRYRRMLRKDKLKMMMKDFEDLKDTDKKAALEKLMEVDKVRVLERMTLKHRNTGKWAQHQKLRAKFFPESRSALKEDILVGRQRREKVAVDEKARETLNSFNETSEFDKTTYHAELIEEPINFINNETTLEEMECQPAIVSNASTKEDNLISSSNEISKEVLNHKVEKSQNTKKVVCLSDTIQFAEAHNLDSLIPDGITMGDDLDDEPKGSVNIAEAFADEDLIAEFREDKDKADKDNQVEGIDLYLPGWGSWGGPNIKDSGRKRKRFFIEPEESAPKKKALGTVIFNEERNKASAHQISNLPYPFTNVNQFESYIRQPIGHTWNPQRTFQKLIAPKVVTKLGNVIEPIDVEDVKFKKPVKTFQPKFSKKQELAKTKNEAF